MKRLTFGKTSVEIGRDRTVTTLPDGKTVCALHKEQPGQASTAERIGCSVEQMNRSHDLMHSLLAHAIGLECSPTLQDVADGKPATELHWIEEAAVIALQRYAHAVGKLNY